MIKDTCPPLGTGSIDFARVQEVAANGGDLQAAITQATTRAAPPESAVAVSGAKTAAKATHRTVTATSAKTGA